MRNLTAQDWDDIDSAITDSLTLIGADDPRVCDPDMLNYIARLRILQRRVRGAYSEAAYPNRTRTNA